MMKERKRNNKGFTLVELIIVIAVMAVLSVVAVPRYIEYVEDSRRGTDRQAIWEAAHAAQIAYVTSEEMEDTEVLVTIDKDGNATYGNLLSNGNFKDVDGNDIEINYDSPSNLELDKEVNTVVPASSYNYKSELYRDKGILISIQEDTGKIKISAIKYVDKQISQIDNKLPYEQMEADTWERIDAVYDGLNEILPPAVKNYEGRLWNGFVNSWKEDLAEQEADAAAKRANFSYYEENYPERKSGLDSAIDEADNYYDDNKWSIRFRREPEYSNYKTLTEKVETYEDIIYTYENLAAEEERIANEKATADYFGQFNSFASVEESLNDVVAGQNKDVTDMNTVKDGLDKLKDGDYKDLHNHINEIVDSEEVIE